MHFIFVLLEYAVTFVDNFEYELIIVVFTESKKTEGAKSQAKVMFV